ncbi:MAG: hypothetical protein ACK4PI_00430 [Tepidisphaerales bacterium]
MKNEKRNWALRGAVAAVAFTGVVLAAGCAAPPGSGGGVAVRSVDATGTAAVGQASAGGVAGELAAENLTAFWFDLAASARVTNDQATRAILLHLDDPAALSDYATRVARLKERRMLPRDFNAPPQATARRGDVAVAVCRILGLRGGLTFRLLPDNPRYAVRTLTFEGIYPDSSPQQGFTGSAFVGVIGAVDDRRRGNPADLPAEVIPGHSEPASALAVPRPSLDGEDVLDYRIRPLVFSPPQGDVPLYMMLQPAGDAPATAPAAGDAVQAAGDATPRKLRVFVTAVQGEQAEFRRSADSPWEKARVGLVLDENAEFRTGDKSSIRFNIPPGQTFTLDRLGTVRVVEAVQTGNRVRTQVAMEQGRVRLDVNETAPGSRAQIERVDADAARIAESGIVHDTTIRSPNSALAVRGTKVSLFDQPPYAPRAVSLTGRAEYLNTRRQAVAFGASGRRSEVEGAQSSAAENAALAAVPQLPAAVVAGNFDAAQLNRVLATGGFLRGDVVVGNAAVDVNRDFSQVALGFVLTFGAPGSNRFQDLNLAVISPLSTPDNPDFVANGPFTTALNPAAPGYEAFRAQFYPRTSPSGGAISRNAVAVPEAFARSGGSTFFRATELAAWPAGYPQGIYRVVVTNFIDALGDPPGRGSDPVPATVNVIVNGRSIGVLGGMNLPVGLYESVVLPFDTGQIPPNLAPNRPAPLRVRRR